MGTPRTIPAGQFKARCLGLLDEVSETGREIVVTKRGRPVARVVPMDQASRRSLAESVLDGEDIVDPINVEWNAGR